MTQDQDAQENFRAICESNAFEIDFGEVAKLGTEKLRTVAAAVAAPPSVRRTDAGLLLVAHIAGRRGADAFIRDLQHRPQNASALHIEIMRRAALPAVEAAASLRGFIGRIQECCAGSIEIPQ